MGTMRAGKAVPAGKTYLLDHAKGRSRAFSGMKAEVVNTVAKLRRELEQPVKGSLWISYDQQLTKALLRNLSRRSAPLGAALLVHDLAPQSLPALRGCFQHVAFSVDGRFLLPRELAQALSADNRADLFIGGSVDRSTETVALWRGNLEVLTVPFSAFPESGDGVRPDFGRLAFADGGQTIRLGAYEAAADAVLYEYDAAYRRRIKKQRHASEQTFGASLRRLRKQRGLRREDFAPAVAAKTVARIEQGQARKVRAKTLKALAARLGVTPQELGAY
jgi:DNA-binding Xre family transcriptional regulator